MGADWRTYCRVRYFEVDGEVVRVSLPNQRVHTVWIEEMGDAYRAWARVATRETVSKLDELPLATWERNRGTELVGFRVDKRGRLIGSAWIPKAGLTATEFRTYVQTVATECDRYEFQLTGIDVH